MMKLLQNHHFLTILIDQVEVEEPENDKGGVEFAERLKGACRMKGYFFRFYTGSKEEDVDYKIIVH